MKKIINGSLFNTETAKEMAYNIKNKGQISFAEERLYLTKSGKYFLAGEGGPSSAYARSEGLSGWSSGEKIIPLDLASAKEWAEYNLEADEYKAIFGEVEEASDERLPRTFTLSVQAIGKLDRIKQESGESYGFILDKLILDAE